MSYDYIKGVFSSEYIEKLEKNPLLEFKRVLNERTGELSHKRIARYQGLIFTIRLNRVWLSGSLHYFYNRGQHNFNDFNYFKVIKTLSEIEKTFDLDLSNCKLENIEIGVNIRLPFKTSHVLNNVLFHGTKRFKDENVKRGKGDFRIVMHDRFGIKIYDKGLQFGLPYELMRFEIHYRKMADLKKYGISYLSDLKDRENLEYFKKELIKRFDEVFLYDWTIQDDMIKRKPKDFYKWGLWNYWIQDMNRSNRMKRKKMYNKLLDKYSNNIHKEIRGLIERKINNLISPKATFSQ